MNKIKHCFGGLLVLTLLLGCKDKPAKPEAETEKPLVVIYAHDDSLAIAQLVNVYVETFNTGDFEKVADMLYTVHSDSIEPLTSEQRASYVQAMQQIGRYGCQLKDMQLNTFKDNKVRLAVLMNENGSLEDEQGTVNFFLNPVKINNEWVLTLYDKYAEGVGEHLNVVHEVQE